MSRHVVHYNILGLENLGITVDIYLYVFRTLINQIEYNVPLIPISRMYYWCGGDINCVVSLAGGLVCMRFSWIDCCS